MHKPITVSRQDYITSICDLTNNSGLPAFVVIDVLESVLRELRPMVENEYKRDKAAYEAASKEHTDIEQE